MKSLRVWLLLLLAFLLPLRGALAAGMLCPVGEFGVQPEAQLVVPAHGEGLTSPGHEHQHQGVSAHDHGSAHGHSDSAGHDHAGSADQCNSCSAFCSVPGLISASVTVPEPQPVSAVFPHLYAPPPSFVSDGQERPPRTI